MSPEINMSRASCKVDALKKLEFKRCEYVKFSVTPGLSQGRKEYWTGNNIVTLTFINKFSHLFFKY